MSNIAKNPDRFSWPPTRADALGGLSVFVVVYCVLNNRWEGLAGLALVICAFAVAFPRMIGRWRVGGAPPSIEAELVSPVLEGEFTRYPPSKPTLAPEQSRAKESGGD